MARRSPEITAYIAKSPAYARPILERIRTAFHAGCPGLEERIKWGMPSFEYKGLLGGMAAFQKHVTFGFWKSQLMEEFGRHLPGETRASVMGGKAESVADLPSKSVLVAYVKEARRLNDEGVKAPKPARPKRTIRVTVPADLQGALVRDPRAAAAFRAFPPSAKRDYVEWITEAKRPETRARRLSTAVAWIAAGKRRNWKYERGR